MTQTISTLLISNTAVFSLKHFVESMNLDVVRHFAFDLRENDDVQDGALEIQGKTAEQVLELRPFGTIDMLPYDAFCEPAEFVELNIEELLEIVDEHFIHTFVEAFDTQEELDKFIKATEELHGRQIEIYKDDAEALAEVEVGYGLAQRAIALVKEKLTPKC
jgi:hypothetical protein